MPRHPRPWQAPAGCLAAGPVRSAASALSGGATRRRGSSPRTGPINDQRRTGGAGRHGTARQTGTAEQPLVIRMDGTRHLCTSAHRALLAARVVRGNARRSSPGPAKGCPQGDLMASPDFVDDRPPAVARPPGRSTRDSARVPGGDMGTTATILVRISPLHPIDQYRAECAGIHLHLWNDSETASLRTVPQAGAGLGVPHACHTHAARLQVSIQHACCTPSAQMQESIQTAFRQRAEGVRKAFC